MLNEITSFLCFDFNRSIVYYRYFLSREFFVRRNYSGLTNIFTKKLYFYIEIQDWMKNGARDTFVKAYSAGFFEGQIPIRIGKTSQLYYFRLIDANSNGCFNDYGKDLVYIDLHRNGYFRKDASHTLVEYFDYTELNIQKQQRRVIVLPYPAKIAVTKVNEDMDLSALEPNPGQPIQTDLEDSIQDQGSD